MEEDIKKEILLNYIESKKNDNNDKEEEFKDYNEESNDNLNKENSFLNEELLNNSGVEAPPASKVSYL